MFGRTKNLLLKEHIEKLANNSIPLIDTAAGAGAPVGVGEVPIVWYNYAGTYHQFILTEVFHVPDSPVNIMGISAFFEDYRRL